MKQRLDSLLDPWCGQFIIWNHPMKFSETPKKITFKLKWSTSALKTELWLHHCRILKQFSALEANDKLNMLCLAVFLHLSIILFLTSVIPEGRPQGTHLNRGPMAATCRFRLPLAPPMFRDRERWRRLEKISIWSELQYLAISNLCTRNWEKETDIPCLLQPFGISNPTPRLLCFKHLSPHQWLCSSKQSVLSWLWARLQSFPKSQQQEIQTATARILRRNTHLYPDVMWGHLWWTGPWLALLWGC